ncbi:hypothetical protein JTE90_011128 [Oedothorax gibbosus]|uniref:Uncharacterized protein n=1 Tax=Oedothorax gibbosus TaxID=931172 RepID=A0AAV6TE41_9ARAC|nr:hypothetical protein JTE90_011128 [Oedothorax gibbosus]
MLILVERVPMRHEMDRKDEQELPSRHVFEILGRIVSGLFEHGKIDGASRLVHQHVVFSIRSVTEITVNFIELVQVEYDVEVPFSVFADVGIGVGVQNLFGSVRIATVIKKRNIVSQRMNGIAENPIQHGYPLSDHSVKTF